MTQYINYKSSPEISQIISDLSHPCIPMVQMLTWAAMALPVIASFLAWTAGWMETELEELDLSGLVAEMTTGSTGGRSRECIYSFPSPTVLRSSSLERIWLEQVVSACFQFSMLDEMNYNDYPDRL